MKVQYIEPYPFAKSTCGGTIAVHRPSALSERLVHGLDGRSRRECGEHHPVFTMTTLRELKSELAEVDQLLHATWMKEREDARRRIAELAVEFQLSPTTVTMDVEAAHRRAAPTPVVLRPPKFDLPLRSEGVTQHLEARYRNVATGESWSGRGPRPRWLRTALDAGAVLEDFVVASEHEREINDPLREFQDTARRAKLAGRVRGIGVATD